MTVRTQNYTHELVKNTLNSGNACFYSVQITMLFIFLKYSVNKLHKITSFVLSGSQTWSLILRIYIERVSAQILEANISTSKGGSN